jgi:two-component system LytT family response regulator
MRVVLVDDERLARAVLRGLLAEHPDVEIVGEATGLDEAVEVLQRTRPDVVFLDVQMPDGEGIALFERMDVRARVVFVTAFDHYAVRAFELNALDYLLKPVEPERLDRALARARQEPPRVEEVAPEGPIAPEQLLCLPHRGGMRFFRPTDLVHLEAADDYCVLHLDDGASLLSSTPLKTWEAQLPDDFLRTHRSHLVRTDAIEEVRPEGSAYVVRLRGDREVPMSRRRGATLLEQLRGP